MNKEAHDEAKVPRAHRRGGRSRRCGAGADQARAADPDRRLAALTGKDALQGGYVREGYLLCQKQVNQNGGVLGRPVEFVIHDDGSDEQTAVGLYEKLITEDKVDAVLGPYGVPITDAVADVTEKHRKLMIAPPAATT